MSDPYWWSPTSRFSVEDFVQKYAPSKVNSEDTTFLVVQGHEGEKEDLERGKENAPALLEAATILEDLQNLLKAIERDTSLPNTAKKGSRSKRAARDEVSKRDFNKRAEREAFDDAKKELRKLSIRSRWTSGKWLLFPKHEEVDHVWSVIAPSVALGLLRDAGVSSAKVAATDALDDEANHVLCLYMPNVYDVAVVRKVCAILLSEHGIEPSAVKSDLYTLAGIDSKHPTGLRSSIWRPSEVFDGGLGEVRELQARYAISQRAKRTGTGDKGATPKRAKPNGIIDSDSEDERIAQRLKMTASKTPPVAAGKITSTGGKSAVMSLKKPTAAVKSSSNAARYRANDIFAGSDGE